MDAKREFIAERLRHMIANLDKLASLPPGCDVSLELRALSATLRRILDALLALNSAGGRTINGA